MADVNRLVQDAENGDIEALKTLKRTAERNGDEALLDKVRALAMRLASERYEKMRAAVREYNAFADIAGVKEADLSGKAKPYEAPPLDLGRIPYPPMPYPADVLPVQPQAPSNWPPPWTVWCQTEDPTAWLPTASDRVSVCYEGDYQVSSGVGEST